MAFCRKDTGKALWAEIGCLSFSIICVKLCHCICPPFLRMASFGWVFIYCPPIVRKKANSFLQVDTFLGMPLTVVCWTSGDGHKEKEAFFYRHLVNALETCSFYILKEISRWPHYHLFSDVFLSVFRVSLLQTRVFLNFVVWAAITCVYV